jgi:hypothetical protein
MKKVCIVILALACLAGFAFAADKASSASAPSSDKPLFAPGNLSAQVDLGSGFFWGLDISGGAEYGLGSFKVADTIPLTYGVAARVGYSSWSIFSYSYNDFFLGGLGTLHLSWKDVLPDIKWLAKIESYAGLGLGADIHNETDTYYNGVHPAFVGIEGNNWYITPNIAINLEEGYFGYGYNSWGRFGVLFKL